MNQANGQRQGEDNDVEARSSIEMNATCDNFFSWRASVTDTSSMSNKPYALIRTRKLHSTGTLTLHKKSKYTFKLHGSSKQSNTTKWLVQSEQSQQPVAYIRLGNSKARKKIFSTGISIISTNTSYLVSASPSSHKPSFKIFKATHQLDKYKLSAIGSVQYSHASLLCKSHFRFSFDQLVPDIVPPSLLFLVSLIHEANAAQSVLVATLPRIALVASVSAASVC